MNLTQSQREKLNRKPLYEIYAERIEMELLNIVAEQKVRDSQDEGAIATLEKLLHCEGRSL